MMTLRLSSPSVSTTCTEGRSTRRRGFSSFLAALVCSSCSLLMQHDQFLKTAQGECSPSEQHEHTEEMMIIVAMGITQWSASCIKKKKPFAIHGKNAAKRSNLRSGKLHGEHGEEHALMRRIHGRYMRRGPHMGLQNIGSAEKTVMAYTRRLRSW